VAVALRQCASASDWKSEASTGNEMTLEVEEIVDGGMHAQEQFEPRPAI